MAKRNAFDMEGMGEQNRVCDPINKQISGLAGFFTWVTISLFSKLFLCAPRNASKINHKYKSFNDSTEPLHDKEVCISF